MKDIILEQYNKSSTIPISIKGIETILFQMRNCVCKIHKKIGINGGGFSTNIPCPGVYFLSVLITNYHILDNKYINLNKKIELTQNKIKIDEEGKIFFLKNEMKLLLK